MKSPIARVLICAAALTLAIGGTGCGDSGGDPGTTDDTTDSAGADVLVDDAGPEQDSLVGDDDSGPVADGAGGPPTDVGLSDGQGPEDDTPGDADAVDGTPDGSWGPDASAAADAGPECSDELPLDPAVIAEQCATQCESITGSGCDLGPVGGDEAACVAACTADVACDGWQLANFVCYEQACDATACQLGGASLPPEPACDAACASLDACDMLDLIGQPEDEPAVCRAACSGSAATNIAIGPIIACITDAMDPTCDGEAAMACSDGTLNDVAGSCVSFCASFLAPGGEDYCEPGSPIYTTWADVDACAEECVAEMPDVASTLRMFGCMIGVGCGQADLCLDVPDADDQGCVDACDAIVDLCGAGGGGLEDPAFCSPVCTGVGYVLGAVNETAGQCMSDLGTCPGGSDEIGGALFACVIPTDPICGSVCEELVACLPEDALDLDECVTFCSLKAGPFADPAGMLECIEAAPGGACGAVLACIPEDGPVGDPLCQAMCGKLEDDCSLPPFSCVEGCTAELAPEAGLSVAGKLCNLLAPCDSLEQCVDLDDTPVSEDCQAACGGAATASCGGYPGGCEAACHGISTVVQMGASDAACVMEALGPDCDLNQIGLCFGG